MTFPEQFIEWMQDVSDRLYDLEQKSKSERWEDPDHPILS